MFRSLLWAGFECATGVNARGEWIDQIAATGHDRFLDEDYARVAALGLRTVREGVRWPLVDRRGRLDFSTLDPVIAAAGRRDLEVIYDLFHFGYPDGVDLFSEEFLERFEDYCYAVARRVTELGDAPAAFTPVNEPSFFAWAAGEAASFAPHERGRGWELKVWLARAAIRGADAIWAAWPGARIVNADPICRIVAPPGVEACDPEIEEFNERLVYQAYDIISGRLLPEYGGSPRHLGVVGINYYWTNQWEHGRPCTPLDDHDPRRASLGEIVRAVWRRYGCEVAITETSHVGDARARWFLEAVAECAALVDEGIPLRGLCLYPVLGMPEWHEPDVWTQMGLWEVDTAGEALERVLHAPLAEALDSARVQLEALAPVRK